MVRHQAALASGQLTRVTSGVNLPPSEVIMSRRRSRGGVSIETLVKRLTSWLHLQPLLAVTLWGGIYPGAKLGLREIPVLSFTYLRILLAVIV